jgi:hypothetical protein
LDVKVDIDAEQVNKMIAEAVLNSVLGKEIKKHIQDYASKINSTYDNPIKDIVKRTVDQIVWDILNADYKEAIRAEITRQLADKMSDEFIEGIAKAGLAKRDYD